MKKDTSELLKALEACENFSTYYDENSQNFVNTAVVDELNRLLEEKGLKKSEVIHKAEMSEIYGYQIFAGTRRPGRMKLINIFLAMGLDLCEAQNVLKVCGFPQLYVKNARDCVCIYAIQNKYTVSLLNALLAEYGFKVEE